MTVYIVSKNGVRHEPKRIDWRESTAFAECGYAGAPVELTTEGEIAELDECGSCYPDDVDDVDSEDGGE